MAEAIAALAGLDGDLGDWHRAAMLHGAAQALLDQTGVPWDTAISLALDEIPIPPSSNPLICAAKYGSPGRVVCGSATVCPGPSGRPGHKAEPDQRAACR